jgi:hypothetical protein
MDSMSNVNAHIEGHLNPSWIAWFEGLSLRHEENGQTVLTGPLADQAALHGLLMRIRDLGIPLISVNRIESVSPQKSI